MNVTTYETPILIIGASASGVCAALQAARRGKDVILTEPSPWVGGMLTGAGVSAIDGNHRLPSGLWGEFRERLRTYYGGAQALETGWVSNTHFEPSIGHQIIESMLSKETRIQLFRGWTPGYIEKQDNRIGGAIFIDAQGEFHRVKSEICIFADEFGDLLPIAELPWHTGLEGQKAYNESIGPLNPLPHAQDFTWTATLRRSPDLVLNNTSPEWSKSGVFGGIISSQNPDWNHVLNYGLLPNNRIMINWPIHGNDHSGADLYKSDRTNHRKTLFDQAQEKTIQLVENLQTLIEQGTLELDNLAYPYNTNFSPTFDLLYAEKELESLIGRKPSFPLHPWHPPKSQGLALIPYIRESRRIFGVKTLILDDLMEPDYRIRLNDSIAVGDYPLDHHRQQDPEDPNIDFPPIRAFSVPFGALLPRETQGLLVIEKSISVSGIVNGATRLQPVVMQLGQAAGMAAALALELNKEPSDLPISLLQEELVKAGAYLAPTWDTHPTDNDFIDLQLSVVRGEKKLRYESKDWANQAYVRT